LGRRKAISTGGRAPSGEGRDSATTSPQNGRIQCPRTSAPNAASTLRWLAGERAFLGVFFIFLFFLFLFFSFGAHEGAILLPGREKILGSTGYVAGLGRDYRLLLRLRVVNQSAADEIRSTTSPLRTRPRMFRVLYLGEL
jgi:hypothetical protein